MTERPRDVAWDVDVWTDVPMSGAAHYVSNETPETAPVILVPDDGGGYREHRVIDRPKGRLGFFA